MSAAEHQPDDSLELADALDSYVAAVQSGGKPDRAEFLARHPELAETIACLEALDQLAPKETPVVVAPAAEGFVGSFGKYEVIEEIGRGGMGVVYKARQKDLDRTVALKVILAGALASPELVQRFVTEARAAARLQHPNIVRVYDVGELDGRNYFAMEHIAGSTLADVTQRGPLDPTEAARLVSAVARAVDYLHTQGVIHRDLKPSNILLDAQGRPYVTDFGLAKLLDAQSQLTRSGIIAGTPAYMSPEAASGRASEVGPRSDIFSLGVLLYELIAGRPPFRADTPLDTLVQVIESEPTLLRVINPRVPRELELVCLRCLEKSPEARYASAGALAADLERFLAGDTVEAQPPGAWQQLRRWCRRQPALASRLAALAVCAAVSQVNYQFTHNVSFALHFRIMSALFCWALVSAGCQWLLKRERWPETMRFLWAGADVVLLTALLKIDDALASPLIVAYPLLIAASGLWFRARLVAFATAASALGYALLVLDLWMRTGALSQLNWHLIYVVALAIIGFVVAYQVHRVRALSRFYERRLP